MKNPFRASNVVGKAGFAIGIATALLFAVAMPGKVGAWPLLFVALAPLLFICLYNSPKKSAVIGWVTGFVYHLLLLYWIVIVLSRYGGLPSWVAFFALLLLSAYMGLYYGLFCFLLSTIAGRSWHKERSVTVLVWSAPVLWTGMEYLRSFVFSGFPWMDLGYGLYRQPQLIQGADLGGHYTVSFALVLCSGFIVALIDRQRIAVRWNLRMERRLLLFAGGFIVFFFGYSFLRYDIVNSTFSRGLQAKVAVVQGNVDQGQKWSPAAREKTVQSYVKLSDQVLGNRDTELVVWPETALPFYLQNNPLALKVKDFLVENNVWLLTGSPVYDIVKVHENGQKDVDYFNSALLLNPDGYIAGRYDKQHLVPFGEYIPFGQYFSFLSPLVESAGNFTAGTSGQPLDMGRIKLGILICFESIFPDIARVSVTEGANLLVNLTNDAWYGRSSAPYQSLAMSVFRAVETKRYLVRSANTGVSAFIDPVGNIFEETEIFSSTVRSKQVVLWEELTVFCRSGYLFGACCLCGAVSIFIFRRKK